MKISNKRFAAALAGWLVLGAFAMSIPLTASARKSPTPKPTVVIKGASHVVMVSHPTKVAALIELAALAK